MPCWGSISGSHPPVLTSPPHTITGGGFPRCPLQQLAGQNLPCEAVAPGAAGWSWVGGASAVLSVFLQEQGCVSDE